MMTMTITLLESKNIFLIGPTGAGKSTVGTLLAEKMKWNYVDIDALIETQQNQSINTIFSESGEPFFRELETNLLKEEAQETQKTVIATGAGIILNPFNIEVMKQNGVMIYLKVSIEEQLKRIQQDTKNSRPLLESQDILLTLQTMALRRNELYEQAEYSVDTDGLSSQQVMDLIMNGILSRYA
jgi:shikimate kinase